MSAPTETSTKTDGRHARGESSRARIVAAMLDLVAAGDIHPSAAKVAEAAGVGMRTVFHHFNDMDSLYREMSLAITARVTPLFKAPLVAQNWQDRIRETAQRRMQAFEIVSPYRVSASIKRFQSDFLMKDFQRLVRRERTAVEILLPPAARADTQRTNMLLIALSFHTWRMLRQEQQLSVGDAEQVMLGLVNAVLMQFDSGPQGATGPASPC
ncbi:MAG: TetR/AcrR family transcriptional regulator [Sphingomonas sp.]|jgi:AcrR family transcriptional regulator